MTRPAVAIVHYSCPPVIGGVEFIIEAHARLFAEAGHPTRLVVGTGGTVHPRCRTVCVPELASDGGPHAAVVARLMRGDVPDTFEAAVQQTETQLNRALRGVGVCMIHNMLTMHFNLVATAALARIMARRGDRVNFIGWSHDLTFKEPVYAEHQHARYPWDLMKTALPGCRYCAISHTRRKDVGRVLGLPPAQVPVIPDGVDVAGLLGLTPVGEALYRDEHLARQDIVALTPARVLRRKNLELGVEIVAALKRRGRRVRWFITGAPDPHNPEARRYGRMLKRLIRERGVSREVVFLGERLDRPVSDEDLRGLFRLADCLLFPSSREGFGLPVLEGALARLLIVMNDIPVLRELKAGDAIMIRRRFTPDDVAERMIRRLDRRHEIAYRKHVMATYGWHQVFRDHILPAALSPGTVWRGP